MSYPGDFSTTRWPLCLRARMDLIGFAPDKNVDPKTYFDLKDPLPPGKRLLFLSVSAYERIFKDQP